MVKSFVNNEFCVTQLHERERKHVKKGDTPGVLHTFDLNTMQHKFVAIFSKVTVGRKVIWGSGRNHVTPILGY